MPRNVAGIYSYPAGTAPVNGQIADAVKQNSRWDDLSADANASRPISAGGTGGTTASEVRTNLGLRIGTDVQAYDPILKALANLTPTANKLPYITGATTMDVTQLSVWARTLIDDVDAPTARATLGVTTGAVDSLTNANNLNATGEGLYGWSSGVNMPANQPFINAVMVQGDAYGLQTQFAFSGTKIGVRQSSGTYSSWLTIDASYLSTITSNVQSQINALGSKQPGDADLTAIAALSAQGYPVRTADGVWTLRGFSAGAGLSLTDFNGVGGSTTYSVSYASTLQAETGTNTALAMNPALTKSAIEARSAGYGTWTDLTGSRVLSTAPGDAGCYRNTTNRPIMVSVNCDNNGTIQVSATSISAGYVTVYTLVNLAAESGSTIVPPGHWYRVTNSGALNRWTENR